MSWLSDRIGDNPIGSAMSSVGLGNNFLSDTPIGYFLGMPQNEEAKRQFNTSLDWQKYQFNKQIEMSNTAHQREIKDLEKSGLNPILSYGGEGLATPSGVGSPAPTAHMNDGSTGLNFITSLLSSLANQKVANATAKTAEAQAFEHNALGLKHIADTDLSRINAQLGSLDIKNYSKKFNSTLSRTPEGFADYLGRFYDKATNSPTAKSAEVIGNKLYDFTEKLKELGSTLHDVKSSSTNVMKRTQMGKSIKLIRDLQKYAVSIFK